MLTKEQLHEKIASGVRFLDGATGSNLRKAGMPNGVCTETWVLEHPEILMDLQLRYAQAGSQIIYAPTFQAQPIALRTVGLEDKTEEVNAKLIALSRTAAPDCLIAGDLTTLAAFCDSWDEGNFDLLVENYRRQIRGLIDGGADASQHTFASIIKPIRTKSNHAAGRFSLLRCGGRSRPAEPGGSRSGCGRL